MTQPTTLTPDQYLAHIKADSERMAALSARDLTAEVPPCPGWTVTDVITHTGSVYSHKVACMRNGRPQREDDWEQGPGEDKELVGWFRLRAYELMAELAQRGPDAPSFTWYDELQTVGFWFRRMAQETVVHRVDVESAFDVVTPVDDALAVDGIDEVLDWFLTYQAQDVGPDGPGRGTVAIRTGDHIWRVTLNADDVELDRSPGPAAATVAGEPSELLLWLWGRRPDSAVRVDGDDGELVAGLRARLEVVTQ